MGAWARLSGTPNLFTLQTLTGLIQDAAPDIREARADLGYRPRPFSEGLAGLHSLRGCLSPASPPAPAAAIHSRAP
jgi:hypothetical protein